MANSFITKISKGIIGKIENALSNPYKKVGISWMDIRYLKNASGDQLRKVKVLGSELNYRNPFEVYHGVKEIFADEIYKQALPENAVVFDCGAHIGMSVIYLKHICPTAKITAFEPDAKNFELISQNVKSFGYEDGVTLMNSAVWIENTTLQFKSDSDMSSHILTGNETGTSSYSVNAVRLRDLMTTKIDFLKIDIEGAEYEVMKDIEDKLHLVNNLFLEYHGNFEDNYKLDELLQILTRIKFKYYIAEALKVYETPFLRKDKGAVAYDVQLNIHCFR